MATTATGPAAPAQGGDEGKVEVPRFFFPSPERVSQFLEMNVEEVAAQIASVDGRKDLYRKILEHEDQIKEFDPTFDSVQLERQMEYVGEELAAKQRFLEETQEKKGIFRRAWDKVKGFAKKHPVKTALLVAALVAGGVSGTLYLSGFLQANQAAVATEVIHEFLEGTDLLNVGIGGMEGFQSIQGVPLGK